MNKLFNDQQSSRIEQLGLVPINSDTTMNFTFVGTGCSVFAVKNVDSIPPIPDSLSPQWKCHLYDDQGISQDITGGLHGKHSQTLIPDDGMMQYEICQARLQEVKNYTLSVKVEIRHIPAYFHSIRYVTPSTPECPEPFSNTTMRIDPQDPCHIRDSTNWSIGPKMSFVEDPQSSSNMTVWFQGEKLQWFGDSEHFMTDTIELTLDGKRVDVGPTPPNHIFSVSSSPLFAVVPDPGTNISQPHLLNVYVPSGNLTLHHLLVTSGDPKRLQLLTTQHDSDHDSDPPKSSSPSALSKDAIIGVVVGIIVGMVLMILAVFLALKCSGRGRRRKETWKDSALPSAIEHPASRVSSRSSFSRELVTGDIEYNPEAQKKMDALEPQTRQGVTRPASALILHADSGIRIRLRASEIPPQYTRV
ncbi:hypothetical protein NP233_g6458 [Leucocoprinus birnbaumii]|uniref:Uncharacterized protein n=1 Tax=Leucocoprinus birnbaumii TaxID=56174 RepID=A0AAD5VQZ5_9AGAR|nr:hypothetical protein NP233_g6458 [Leucocoprinus birnbaumii]